MNVIMTIANRYSFIVSSEREVRMFGTNFVKRGIVTISHTSMWDVTKRLSTNAVIMRLIEL